MEKNPLLAPTMEKSLQEAWFVTEECGIAGRLELG